MSIEALTERAPSDSTVNGVMKALVYGGPGQRAWETKPKPTIRERGDAIVRITRSTICGTDLHILKGDVPSVTPGRILGHEGVGVIEAIGSSVTSFHSGDLVLISRKSHLKVRLVRPTAVQNELERRRLGGVSELRNPWGGRTDGAVLRQALWGQSVVFRGRERLHAAGSRPGNCTSTAPANARNGGCARWAQANPSPGDIVRERVGVEAAQKAPRR
jgi:Alcohol dehydrogenase GroES-like domain